MKKWAFGIPLVGILCFSLYAYEYVYPVGSVEYYDQEEVLVLYQKSLNHTEVYLYNPDTKQSERVLLSSFTPVGVSLLPNNAGFSFFDNGRLYVKQFIKRSPKALDIYEPIYDIGPVQWVSEEKCVFHAKEREKFSLYRFSCDGSLCRLVEHTTFDCFYPSLKGISLFYLMKDKEEEQYWIMRTEWEATEQCEPVSLVHHTKPLAFLTMTDATTGIVIEHPSQIDIQKDKEFVGTCYKVSCNQQGVWSLSFLFSFTLPLSLLLPSSSMRLLESIYPLLPKVYNDTIWFVSLHNGVLIPYTYTPDQGVMRIELLPQPYSTDVFSPCLTKNCVVFGGVCSMSDMAEEPTEALISLTK